MTGLALSGAYAPGDRVRSLPPDGETGSIIEMRGHGHALVLWDDNTTSLLSVSFVVPSPPIGGDK